MYDLLGKLFVVPLFPLPGQGTFGQGILHNLMVTEIKKNQEEQEPEWKQEPE